VDRAKYEPQKDKLALKGMWSGSCDSLFNFGLPPVCGTDEGRHFKYGT